MLIVAPVFLLACHPLQVQTPVIAEEVQTPIRAVEVTMVSTVTEAKSNSAIAPLISIEQNASVVSNTGAPLLPVAKWQLISAFDAERQPIALLNKIKDNVQLTLPTEGSLGMGYTVGCNARGGNFRLQELGMHSSILTVTDEMGDAQMCPDLLDAEQLLGEFMEGRSQLQLLTAAKSKSDTPIMLQITEEGSVLLWQARVDKQAKGLTVQLIPATTNWLSRYDWTLDFAIDNRHLPIAAFKAIPKIAQVKAELKFNEANTEAKQEVGFGYKMGCNWHSAGYTLLDGQMTKPSRLTISTLMGCNDEIEQAEGQLGRELASPSRFYALEGSEAPLLVQTNERGSLLLWQGQAKTVAMGLNE
ncbi:META domain-containing protein [Psychrobacter arenosus]|uniref:META domain-containing protein n=1 Tax=Psychrobacter arenosus TaxID=256326 RepID=UPI001919CBF4|nr:META domain-containing protein [Psychrobacter arenosus]